MSLDFDPAVPRAHEEEAGRYGRGKGRGDDKVAHHELVVHLAARNPELLLDRAAAAAAAVLWFIRLVSCATACSGDDKEKPKTQARQ